jgi:RNA polymerase sigma factor (sigma-70 family)
MEQMSTAGLSARLRWRRAPALRSQAARHDAAALAAMYERHHQALYRYCRSILHDDEDARDALQSTMAKALAALRDEERDFELRPWLFRIAHNEAISRLRQRRDVVDLDAVGTLGTDSMAQTLEDRERLALLRADLGDLPDRQRVALVLRELSGLSHEEIASVLDSSARAVKQTIFEARAGLQECAEGRTMLCADVQRALSDGDGRVLRGRRMRAHVRSCRACRQFKTALAQRPGDLAALAPALPPTVGAALLAHLLPGAKAGLASGVSTAAGAGGGVAATMATKAAIVAVATVSIAGTGTVVHNTVTAREPVARPAATATSATPPASAPAASPRTATGRLVPSVRRDHGRPPAPANRHASGPSGSAHAKAVPAAGALPARAAPPRPGAKGRAVAQAKRQAVTSNARRAGLKTAKAHPGRPPTGRPTATAARKAHREHPATPATAAAPAEPAGARAPGRPTDIRPPDSAGAAHSPK